MQDLCWRCAPLNRGQGFPHIQRHGRGDQIVKIVVETPKRLDAEGKALFAKLAELERRDLAGTPRLKTFLGKLKEYFGYES